MEHIYKNLNFGEDWFEYPRLYSFFVSSLPDDSAIVEVGSWKGKSTAYLAVEIINSAKNIKVKSKVVNGIITGQSDEKIDGNIFI
jgi:hypothetical protein